MPPGVLSLRLKTSEKGIPSMLVVQQSHRNQDIPGFCGEVFLGLILWPKAYGRLTGVSKRVLNGCLGKVSVVENYDKERRWKRSCEGGDRVFGFCFKIRPGLWQLGVGCGRDACIV